MYPLTDNTPLHECLLLWEQFLSTLRKDKTIAVAYHGDTDGVVGAAYVQEALRQIGAESVESTWIGTEEYDFRSLFSWLERVEPTHCIVLDISIASTPMLRELTDRVAGTTFIYDHHLTPNYSAAANVIFANPTPAPLKPGQLPWPTFAFAFLLSANCRLCFPDWLLLLASFAEGIDKHIEKDIETLLRTSLGMGLESGGSIRQMYLSSELPRVNSLIRAGFDADDKNNGVLDSLHPVVTGKLGALAEFRELLESQFAERATEISREIQREVGYWLKSLAVDASTSPTVVFLPIEHSHSVASPVTSIVRGHFPHKLIVAVVRRPGVAIVELRTGQETGLILPEILKRISVRVPLINYGGHQNAAGAILNADRLTDFKEELVRIVK